MDHDEVGVRLEFVKLGFGVRLEPFKLGFGFGFRLESIKLRFGFRGVTVAVGLSHSTEMHPTRLLPQINLPDRWWWF